MVSLVKYKPKSKPALYESLSGECIVSTVFSVFTVDYSQHRCPHCNRTTLTFTREERISIREKQVIDFCVNCKGVLRSWGYDL